MSGILGVDIGGTFTDLVHLELETGEVTVEKVPSQHGQLQESLRDGLDVLEARHDIHASEIATVVHGTTVATNAVLERALPTIAMITTTGFGDVLEIGTMMRPHLYDLRAVKVAPIVDRASVIEVHERIDASGAVVTELDSSTVAEVLERLRALAPEAVAICLIFGHVNPEHEEALARAVRAEFPAMAVATSADVDPEMREFARANTTALNASLAPLVERYVRRFSEVLTSAGADSELLIMQSNGGLIPPQDVARNAHRLVLSGPAGGVVAAQRMLPSALGSDFITFDVGGTSSDLCLVVKGQAEISLAPSALDMNPVRASALNITAVGAGGGSIASVDDEGLLSVGPVSAGSMPGPVCYGRGGTQPTVTDAQLVLGRISPEGLLGGDMPLDLEASREVIRVKIADRLGLGVEDAAEAILTIAVASMERGLRKVSVDAGYEPKDFALVAYGGGGPLQAFDVADAVGMGTVIVPPASSAFSALGLLSADMREDFVETISVVTASASSQTLDVVIDRLLERARGSVVSHSRSERSQLEFVWWMDLRYVGQSGALRIEVESAAGPSAPSVIDVDTLVSQFHAEHHRVFGHASDTDPVELVSLRVNAVRRRPQTAVRVRRDSAAGTSGSSRKVHFASTGWVDADVVVRGSMPDNEPVAGPAVLEDRESTTVVPPGAVAVMDPSGAIVISLNHEEGSRS